MGLCSGINVRLRHLVIRKFSVNKHLCFAGSVITLGCIQVWHHYFYVSVLANQYHVQKPPASPKP